MNLEYLLASLYVGVINRDLTVETARTKQRLVQNVGTVGGGNNDDALIYAKAVHFNKQLVKRLFTFVVTAAEACTSLTSYGVNFVDKDDCG